MTDGEKDNEAATEINKLLGRIRDLTNGLPAQTNTQTVVHQGLGAWGPAAIVACFATLIGLAVVVVILTHENDKLARRVEILEAWQGVTGNQVSKMAATVEYIEKTDRELINGGHGNSR